MSELSESFRYAKKRVDTRKIRPENFSVLHMKKFMPPVEDGLL